MLSHLSANSLGDWRWDGSETMKSPASWCSHRLNFVGDSSDPQFLVGEAVLRGLWKGNSLSDLWFWHGPSGLFGVPEFLPAS